MSREFWTVGNLMALGYREIVKRHAEDIANLRAERDNWHAMIDSEIEANDEYVRRAEALGCPRGMSIDRVYAWTLGEIARLRENG